MLEQSPRIYVKKFQIKKVTIFEFIFKYFFTGDYKTSLSKVNATNCSLYPSCKNLSDGLYPSSDCKNYFQCKDERTLRLSSCPQNATTGLNLRFNILTRRCDTIDNVSFNCGGYTIPIDLYSIK